MTKALNVLDGTALTLTGVGILGAALAAIDILPSPTGIVCSMAVGVGLIASLAVRKLVPNDAVSDADEIYIDDPMSISIFTDPLRAKTPTSHPLDPTVPGTVNWQFQNDSAPKTF